MSTKKSKNPDFKSIWGEYERGLGFNTQLKLQETVENNENFFIGRV